MVDLSVRIGRLALANPVMPASGTFSEQMADVLDINRLGALVTKTITADIREGNPPPRVAEFKDAVLWSIGIPSKGPAYYLGTLVPFYRQFEPPLVASISADTVEQFGELAARISVPGVAAIEANISCPNLKKDGLAFGMDPDATEQVIRAMTAATRVPVWAKLTPNVGDIAVVARAAEAGGAEAVVVANAMLAMAIDIHTAATAARPGDGRADRSRDEADYSADGLSVRPGGADSRHRVRRNHYDVGCDRVPPRGRDRGPGGHGQFSERDDDVVGDR